MTVLTLFMLTQMPGPRDIVIYWPGPGHFLLRKSPGAGQHFGAKAPGCPGGMVTGQIDTCINRKKICKQLNSLLSRPGSRDFAISANFQQTGFIMSPIGDLINSLPFRCMVVTKSNISSLPWF